MYTINKILKSNLSAKIAVTYPDLNPYTKIFLALSKNCSSVIVP